MMQTEEKPKADAKELHELQLVIEQLATGEISREQAEELLRRIWNEASKEAPIYRVLREFFPSLCGNR